MTPTTDPAEIARGLPSVERRVLHSLCNPPYHMRGFGIPMRALKVKRLIIGLRPTRLGRAVDAHLEVQ